MSIRRQSKCRCPGAPRAKAHTRTDCPHYRSKPLGDFTPAEHAARQCFAFRDAEGRVIEFASQGLCETTLTERFDKPCSCETYGGNMGPCLGFLEGANGRCVYCDHAAKCH